MLAAFEGHRNCRFNRHRHRHRLHRLHRLHRPHNDQEWAGFRAEQTHSGPLKVRLF